MSIVFSFSLYLAGLACWFCINAHINIFLEFVRLLLLCCGTWSLECSPTSCYFYQLLDSSAVTNIGGVIEYCLSLQLNFFFLSKLKLFFEDNLVSLSNVLCVNLGCLCFEGFIWLSVRVRGMKMFINTPCLKLFLCILSL